MLDDKQLHTYTLPLILIGLIIRISSGFMALVEGGTSNSLSVITDDSLWMISILLVWLNRSNLSSFKIDRTSLVIMFIFGSVLRVGIIGEPLAIFLSLIVGSILILSLVIVPRWKTLTRTSIKWAITGPVLGMCFGYLVVYIFGSQDINAVPQLSQFLYGLYVNMSRFVLNEELLFRGFLWGYLETRNWSQIKILFIQGILFWIAHTNQSPRIASFWIILPILAITLGLLVLKSKTITPSLLAHAVYNSIIVALTQ